MVTKVPLCATSDVASGTVKKIQVQGRSLAVYNIDGSFYATEDRCTHGLASLSEGMLDGDVIECTMHFGAFHVPTGKPVAMPCTVPLRVYDVEVDGTSVFISIDAESE